MNSKLIIAIVVLFAVAVGFAAYLSQKHEEPAEEIDTSDWQVYRNEEYGYELLFPNTWKGYEVKSGKDTTYNYDFQKYTYAFVDFIHPQKISNRGNPGKVGFIIGVFNKENWQLAQGWEKLNENKEFVFGAILHNSAAPDDMHERAQEIQFILRTFRRL